MVQVGADVHEHPPLSTQRQLSIESHLEIDEHKADVVPSLQALHVHLVPPLQDSVQIHPGDPRTQLAPVLVTQVVTT